MPTKTRRCTYEECGKHLKDGYFTPTGNHSGSCSSSAYIPLGQNRGPRAVTLGDPCHFSLGLSHTHADDNFEKGLIPFPGCPYRVLVRIGTTVCPYERPKDPGKCLHSDCYPGRGCARTKIFAGEISRGEGEEWRRIQ